MSVPVVFSSSSLKLIFIVWLEYVIIWFQFSFCYELYHANFNSVPVSWRSY